MLLEEFTKKEMYQAQFGDNERLIDYAGKTVNVAKAAVVEDNGNDGYLRKVLHIITPEGNVISSMSVSAVHDFVILAEIFGEELQDLEVKNGTTKRGDEFITLRAGELTMMGL